MLNRADNPTLFEKEKKGVAMKDKTKIIRFILTATVITVCWFCLAEGVVFAKQPGKEHGFSLSEIFTDENRNVQVINLAGSNY